MLYNLIQRYWNNKKTTIKNPKFILSEAEGIQFASRITQGERFIVSTVNIELMSDKKNVINSEKKQLGAHGEQKVAEWLQRKGFTIKATNYRKRYGEIDIIAAKDEVLAFVEVKFRTTHYFNLSEVITPAKQRKIIKTAQAYIMESGTADKVYRFDVALLEKHSDRYKLTYVPNAFTKATY